ncbi:MAG: acyl-CoA dehydrogenase family protein [Actinomycetota bacterium]|nr:acyl-CoA dehydrogenase family protein [Actinomycetota bacterium]
MDFDFSEEQQAISDLTRQILEDKVTHEHLRAMAKAGESFDQDLWGSLIETGVVGASIDEEFGGAGLGFLSVTAVLELIGEFAAPVPMMETIVMGALPIQEFGSAKQKADLLPKIVSGDLLVTAALVSDRTVIASDGRLTGSVDFVPYGLETDVVLIPTDDGVYLVNSSRSGVSLVPRETTTGQLQAAVALEGVEAERLGLASTDEIIAWMRLRVDSGICSVLSGACMASLDLAAEYTKVRQQFNRAIATFQAVSQRAGDAYIDTEAVRLTSRQAAWRIDAGRSALEQVAIARWWAAEAGFRVVHAATHLHGGVGVDRDYPLHRYFLMARQLELTLGNSEEQLVILGDLIAENA